MTFGTNLARGRVPLQLERAARAFVDLAFRVGVTLLGLVGFVLVLAGLAVALWR